MCPRHYIERPDGYIDKILWQKIIDELTQSNPDAVVLPFWRGEPLLHPAFIELLKYAVSKSIKIHISTNGHLVEGIYAGLLSECEFVTFSIHSHSGLRRAKEFLTIRKNTKPIVQVSFVRGEQTTESLLGDIVNSPELSGFDTVRVFEEHTVDGVFGKTRASGNNHRMFCQKLTDTLVIAYDGSISRCNHIWKTQNSVNINNMTLKDVWHSEYLMGIRNSYPDNFCGPCDQWIGHTRGEAWRRVDSGIEHKVFGA
ncbi:MAG: SPASM domain-containing protein [Nitrospirota bacterium]